MKKEKAKQGEFEGMPKRTPLGKAAIKFLGIKDQIDELITKAEDMKPILIKLFKKEKKAYIRVDMRTVSYASVMKDTISVRKDSV